MTTTNKGKALECAIGGSKYPIPLTVQAWLAQCTQLPPGGTRFGIGVALAAHAQMEYNRILANDGAAAPDGKGRIAGWSAARNAPHPLRIMGGFPFLDGKDSFPVVLAKHFKSVKVGNESFSTRRGEVAADAAYQGLADVRSITNAVVLVSKTLDYVRMGQRTGVYPPEAAPGGRVTVNVETLPDTDF